MVAVEPRLDCLVLKVRGCSGLLGLAAGEVEHRRRDAFACAPVYCLAGELCFPNVYNLEDVQMSSMKVMVFTCMVMVVEQLSQEGSRQYRWSSQNCLRFLQFQGPDAAAEGA